MKLSEILTGPETWIQGKLMTRRGQYCIVGAITALIAREQGIALADANHSGAITALIAREQGVALADANHSIWTKEYARFRRVAKVQGIVGWADAPERTWAEIAEAVDAYDRDRMLNP